MSSCIPTHPLVESDHILQKCILNSSRLTYLSRMPSADLTSEPAKKSLHIPLKLLQTQICDGVCVCVLCVCVCVLTTNMSQTLVVPLRGRAWTQRDPTRAHTHTHTLTEGQEQEDGWGHKPDWANSWWSWSAPARSETDRKEVCGWMTICLK